MVTWLELQSVVHLALLSLGILHVLADDWGDLVDLHLHALDKLNH